MTGVAVYGGARLCSGYGSPPLPHNASAPQLVYIGDSISKGIFRHLPPLLPAWEMYHPGMSVRGGCHTSVTGRTCLSQWLGQRRWDVIVFNFGLHDIGHDYERVGAAMYEHNLRNITVWLQRHYPQSTLLWASTTPVPADSVVLHPSRSYFDVLGYNTIAAHVMAAAGIPVLPLYDYAPSEEQLPDNVHYTERGYALLASALAGRLGSYVHTRASTQSDVSAPRY